VRWVLAKRAAPRPSFQQTAQHIPLIGRRFPRRRQWVWRKRYPSREVAWKGLLFDQPASETCGRRFHPHKYSL
jgi:hypothetical protein